MWGEDQDVHGALWNRNPAKPQPSGGNTNFFRSLRLMLKPVHHFTQTWSFHTSPLVSLQSSGNFSGCLTQMFQVIINLVSWFHYTLSYFVFIDTPTFPTSYMSVKKERDAEKQRGYSHPSQYIMFITALRLYHSECRKNWLWTPGVMLCDKKWQVSIKGISHQGEWNLEAYYLFQGFIYYQQHNEQRGGLEWDKHEAGWLTFTLL